MRSMREILIFAPVLLGGWLIGSSPLDETQEPIPEAVRRLSSELSDLRDGQQALKERLTASQGLEETVRSQSETISRLKERLDEVSKELAELHEKVSGDTTPSDLEIGTADGEFQAAIRYRPGFGFVLSLASTNGSDVELSSGIQGGLLSFLDPQSLEAARMGFDGKGGFIELFNNPMDEARRPPSARLAAIAGQGGALTLLSPDGKPRIQMSVDGSELTSVMIGDPAKLNYNLPVSRQRGIWLYVQKESHIIVDGCDLMARLKELEAHVARLQAKLRD